MKIKLCAPFECDLARLQVIAPIDSEDQKYIKDVANLPFFTDGEWRITIELDTGKIVGWPGGQTRDVHITVRDSGTYILIDRSGNEVARLQGYVPNCLVPGEHGDTISLSVDGDGKIKEWDPDFHMLPDCEWKLQNGWEFPS